MPTAQDQAAGSQGRVQGELQLPVQGTATGHFTHNPLASAHRTDEEAQAKGSHSRAKATERGSGRASLGHSTKQASKVNRQAAGTLISGGQD